MRKEVEREVCVSVPKRRGKGFRLSKTKKKENGLQGKIYIDELLRSGIPVKIMGQVYECEAGGAKKLVLRYQYTGEAQQFEYLRCHVQ